MHRRRRRHAVLHAAAGLTAFALAAQTARADYEVPNPAWNPPTTYYNTATGTGFVLRTNLHNIVTTGFHAINYGDARYAMGTGDTGIAGGFEDIDPNNSSNIILVYNRDSIPGQWDNGITWNREHVWPKSLLNLTSSQVSATYKAWRPTRSSCGRRIPISTQRATT